MQEVFLLKRCITWVLCGLLLLTGAALAEDTPQTRKTIIFLEGMEETITETRLDTGRGYAIWYDAEMFALMPEDEGGGMDTLLPAHDTASQAIAFSVVPSGAMTEEYAAETAEAIPESLADNGFTVAPIDVATLAQPYLVSGYQGTKEDAVIEVYFINAEDEYYTITLEYPQEAAEGYGARMQGMLLTFEPVASAE